MIREILKELKADGGWYFVVFVLLLVLVHELFGVGVDPLFFVQ